MSGELTGNDWCKTLGMKAPRLEDVAKHPEANTFSLLIVALLEAGKALTLAQVAGRFADAGIASFERASLSLSRCKPGRAPMYRDGDLYHLDPHDYDLALCVFRLGLVPPKVIVPPPAPAPQSPIPPATQALTAAELDEAWKGASLNGWSSYRVALAVLDTNTEAMTPEEIAAAVASRTKWFKFSLRANPVRRRDCGLTTLADGRWALSEDVHPDLLKTREAVRQQLIGRRASSPRMSAEHIEVVMRVGDEVRAVEQEQRASLRRALLVAYPESKPRVVAFVDITKRTIASYADEEIVGLYPQLSEFDWIGAIGVRALLRALDFDPQQRHLAEMGPPQKHKTLNRQGRTLATTSDFLIRGTCDIRQPLGDA